MKKKKIKEIELVKKFTRCKTVGQIVDRMCGEMIGSGQYRNVYVCKAHPDYVVKIERDMSKANFANAMEWRNYVDNRTWKFLSPWLAPCILINENGTVLIQRRVSLEGKTRKDYPKKIPAFFTDLKVTNFGWIGKRFVCCDYSFFVLTTGKRMKTARWWGKMKK